MTLYFEFSNDALNADLARGKTTRKKNAGKRGKRGG
jgi:hypothetical protein